MLSTGGAGGAPRPSPGLVPPRFCPAAPELQRYTRPRPRRTHVTAWTCDWRLKPDGALGPWTVTREGGGCGVTEEGTVGTGAACRGPALPREALRTAPETPRSAVRSEPRSAEEGTEAQRAVSKHPPACSRPRSHASASHGADAFHCNEAQYINYSDYL